MPCELTLLYFSVRSMAESSDLRHGRHCVFNLYVHLVFVTKYRRKIFDPQILKSLESIFHDVCTHAEAELVEFNGEGDHVHLLINYPPKISISRLVNALKGVSSRQIRKKNYPSIQKALWGDSLWSPSYFAGSAGGSTIEKLKDYIQQQAPL